MLKRNLLIYLRCLLCVCIAQLGNIKNTVAEDENTLSILKGPYLQNVKKDKITVMWETNLNASSGVEYGETAGYGKKVVSGKLKKIHEITIPGLKEETVYHYRVSSKTPSGLGEEVLKITSESYVFKTAVRGNTPFCFAVYGDSRSNVECHTRIAEAIAQKRPDIVLHVGDLVADGKNYKNWGSEFFEPAKKLFSNTPFYIAIGNHEKNAHWFYDFVSYPEPENYYSFDYGNAHFTIIDSNRADQKRIDTSEYRPGSTQYKWLEKDLKDSKSEWKFIFFHHPPYSSSPHFPEKSCKKVRVLSPLFEKYGVDIVFNGHVHNYERSYPIKNNKIDMKQGVIYLVTGGGGAELAGLNQKRSFFTAESAIRYHYCIVKIIEKKLQMMVYDVDDKLLDILIIRK